MMVVQKEAHEGKEWRQRGRMHGKGAAVGETLGRGDVDLWLFLCGCVEYRSERVSRACVRLHSVPVCIFTHGRVWL